MTTRRSWLFAGALAAIVGVGLLLAPRDLERDGRTTPGRDGPATAPTLAAPPARSPAGSPSPGGPPAAAANRNDSELHALERALGAADSVAARAAARDLRRSLRTNPEALARAVERFL